METLEINIIEYDRADNSRVEYSFEQCHFDNPITTFLDLAKNPENFLHKQGKYRIVLTNRQNKNLLKYLAKREFHRDRFGNPRDADYLLAFSYGENPDVNLDLAKITERIGKSIPSIKIAAQWEIADILYKTNLILTHQVCRIELDRGKDYITTDEVIDKFINNLVVSNKTNESLPIFVVAQAWHAPRCIKTCIAKGLHVVGGDFSELFSPYDPQKWVRNAISWILKEGTRKNL